MWVGYGCVMEDVWRDHVVLEGGVCVTGMCDGEMGRSVVLEGGQCVG